MKKIVVSSDQHLGYTNSKADDFRRFLDHVARRNDIEALVVLGDLVDMWRRDVSGLFLEYKDVADRLSNLTNSGINIYVIAGNHDYHLLRLQDPGYQFKFYNDLTLNSSKEGLKYIFKHGWEFDLAQQPLVMEALCHNLSDEAGTARSRVYNFLMILKDHLSDLFNFHGGAEDYIKHLTEPPETRLKPYLTDVEAKACRSVNDNEILIFGHTHRPFVSNDKRVVNAGSWVSEPQTNYKFNTFVELDGDQIGLFRFVDGNTAEDITVDNTIACLPEKA
jgi:UDP-2,3-diacylglucosamine pyrophosphatase LpxH